jgi:hypothetical protein
MRILLSLLLLPLSVEACRLKSEVPVYSLSGPVTTLFRELKLLSSLKGISVFYPAQSGYSGTLVPGGAFMAPATYEALKGSVVFYDHSQDLARRLRAPESKVVAIPITTRDLLPLEVVELVVKSVAPYLQDCDPQVAAFRAEAEASAKLILQKLKRPLRAVVYPGAFSRGRPPELVMANDGIVKWLRQEKKLETYLSELAYVAWSSRLLTELPAKTLHVAFNEAALRRLEKHGEDRYTLHHPGALIPGLDQLTSWLYFLGELQR